MTPDYTRPLPEGEYALRRIVDPAGRPDVMGLAGQFDDPVFKQALAN